MLVAVATMHLIAQAQVVQIPDGPLECVNTGTLTVACLGIPYGQTGGRWKRPVRPTPWSDPRPAKATGAMCLQPLCYDAAGTLKGNCAEECLFLNVWAPRKPPPAGSPGYPVMVWIHGGGYEGGSGDGMNGTHHVEASGGDFVWVTLDYRLNVFGFLGAEQLRSRDSLNSTGNYGLQDQRFAMEWVQRSIGAFGGDKHNVMIDGCSAGAGSTANHAVNPSSWPFFQKVAGESGMFAMWNSLPLTKAQQTFDLLVKTLGCADEVDPIKCLEGKSPYELTKFANDGLFRPSTPDIMSKFSELQWAPVIDGVDVLGHPWALARAGRHFQGPMMLGTSRDEGATFCGTAANMTKAEFTSWSEVNYPGVPTSQIMQLYGDIEPSAGHSAGWWGSAKITGDILFHCGSRMGSRWLSGSHPVFLYSFAPAKDFPGGVIGHCTENPFIQLSDGGRNPLSKAMGRYWYSFAKHGDPNVARDPGSPVWPAYTNESDTNIVFDHPIRTETGLRKQQCDVCTKTLSCEAPVDPTLPSRGR
jgi:carboxylesterase type B